MKTKLLIEQHFHGAFGIDFNTASVEDILFLSKEILKYGIGGIFPTIVTDSIENTKRAISVIKEASQKQTSAMARILGIHLEGIFLNPEKKGIHNPKHFLQPTVENFQLLEDDFIKIVTLAPELIPLIRPSDTFSHAGAKAKNLIDYLNQKGIKVQAGHCVGGNLTGCTGVTHLFNAMTGITHRGSSTALSALINDDIYTEIIADGVHVSDNALKLVFKTKPADKIILISDCLPCTALSPLPLGGEFADGRSKASPDSEQIEHTVAKATYAKLCERGANSRQGACKAGEGLYEFIFADEKVYYDGTKATSKDGTLAGSTALLPDIIKRLANNPSPELLNSQSSLSNSSLSRKGRGEIISRLILNPYRYHNIDLDGYIEWDDEWNILEVNYEK